MVQIAYIMLCHKDPQGVVEKTRQLTAVGDKVVIHFDARAPRQSFAAMREALDGDANVAFARRVKCGWGEWSLVQATLNGLETAVGTFPDATHFYLLSGDCMAIKTAEFAHRLLNADDVDYIESVDFFTSGWIKTGFVKERLVYRHFFNERTQKRLFYSAFHLQRRLGLTRPVPADLEIMIGSQWWCLRRRTVEAVLDFVRRRPDVPRFFRTTWIPDETFFQTLVHHLVPSPEIQRRNLTFLMFSDYGLPVTFYNDHYDLLVGQDYLFARKVSPEATDLKTRLGALYARTGVTFEISSEGRKLHAFLTGRGRIGQRFAPRFWEREATIGRDRELLLVACKKWHVARRLVERIGLVSNVPMVDYVFDEEGVPLPCLGGIESTIVKRTRHRRALMRMLFEHYGTDRLLVCLDTANLDLLKDFFSDRCETRLLEVQCDFSDEYLAGHARRIGLAGERASEETLERLLPTIRNDVMAERDAIRDAEFAQFHRLRERATREENAQALSVFLSISVDQALQIVSQDHLFAD